jgi:hypothetical protein
MQALFIGQTYIDVTFITDHMPTGDENMWPPPTRFRLAATPLAAFCCLGIVPDLIATVANDWLRPHVQDMSAKVRDLDPPAQVNSSSLSFIMPKDGKRCGSALPRRQPHSPLSDSQPQGLSCAACRRPSARRRHTLRQAMPRGRHPDLPMAAACANTHELLEFIDVAIVAEAAVRADGQDSRGDAGLSQEPGLPRRWRHAGEKGLLWYDETGAVRSLPALPIPRGACSIPTAPATCSSAYIYSFEQSRQRLA